MDQGPLVSDEIDAGDDLVRDFDNFQPVKVAFWLKASDDQIRYLYIASDRIDDTNFRVAYGEVLRLAADLRKSGRGYLNPFRVKVVGAANPLAKAALELIQQYPPGSPAELDETTFGGISVDDAYVYPSLHPLTSP